MLVASAPGSCRSGWTESSSGTHCSLQYCTCGFYPPTHCNIAHVAFSLLLTVLLCRWLLHPKPSILAGLDQVMVPTAHCSTGHVASTLLLTIIVQVASTPKTFHSGWTGSSNGTHCSLQYCMCGFYHLTHCNIVQVVSTLLLTVILCRWFLPYYSL